MSDYPRRKPGDNLDFPAALYNELVDGAAERRRRRPAGGGAVRAAAVAGPTVVRVQNTTADPLPAFGVVGIDGVAIDPADNLDGFRQHVTLTGRAPTADDAGRFAVLVRPVPAGGIGYAVVCGAVHVKVDAGDGGDFADVAAGVTDSLVATASGAARILWRKPGSGKQWAVVRIAGGGGGEDAPEFYGQVHMGTANLAAGWSLLPLVNIVP